jgi:hypothetical protein
VALTQDIEGSSKDSTVTLSANGGAGESGEESKSMQAEEVVNSKENTGSFLGSELSFAKRASEHALNSNSVLYPTSASLDKSQDVHEARQGSAIGIYHALATTTLADRPLESARSLRYSEILKVTQKQRVIVRKGDSLAKIIIATYGEFNQQLLHAVMQLNPHISDPNLLFVGQTVELPVIAAQRLY